MKNIQSILDSGVCTGCGICSNICPKSCIKTYLDAEKGYYSTKLDNQTCVNCDLCKNVCPIYTWNNQTGNSFVGNVEKIYSGFSNNATHRRESASGGITTSILIYMFQKSLIDAAVVAFRKKENPLESELRIVSSVEEIYESKGSVYAPTSYNEIIDKIIESPFTKFAIVGLPCHIEGITRLSSLNKKLRAKIFLKLALVCGHTPSIKGYDYSLKHLNIRKESVTFISNRGNGWPGVLKIKMNNNTERQLPHGSKYSWGMTLSSLLFTPQGCRHCIDSTGYSADISICDAWIQKFKSDKIGRNLILVRNEKALSILREMRNQEIISLNEELLGDFIEANKTVFKEKLVINKYRNRALIRKHGFYSNVIFCQSGSRVASFFIGILLFSENIYNRVFGIKFINNCILFTFKVLKYLSLKWIILKKY
jgi:coenzyme F420 hydrogenase subunit beta